MIVSARAIMAAPRHRATKVNDARTALGTRSICFFLSPVENSTAVETVAQGIISKERESDVKQVG